jgi:hypothetical protein
VSGPALPRTATTKVNRRVLTDSANQGADHCKWEERRVTGFTCRQNYGQLLQYHDAQMID